MAEEVLEEFEEGSGGINFANVFYFVATLAVIAVAYKIFTHAPHRQSGTGTPASTAAATTGTAATDALSTTTTTDTVTSGAVASGTNSSAAPPFVVDANMNFTFNGQSGQLTPASVGTIVGGMNGTPGYYVMGQTAGAYGVQILDGDGSLARAVSISAAGSY